MYIPSEVDEDEEDDGVSSPEGEPTGVFLDNGFSPTTDTDNIRKATVSKNSYLLGTVLLKKTGSTTPYEKGSVLTGRGNTHIYKPHTSEHVSAVKPRQRSKVENNCSDSHSLEPVMVKYRSFAQVKDGVVVHKLILTNDERIVDNGQIDLLIGGESSDSKISIADSSKGDVQQNSIINLPLRLGKTTIEIRFADNLKHSLKIAVYEIK